MTDDNSQSILLAIKVLRREAEDRHTETLEHRARLDLRIDGLTEQVRLLHEKQQAHGGALQVVQQRVETIEEEHLSSPGGDIHKAIATVEESRKRIDSLAEADAELRAADMRQEAMLRRLVVDPLGRRLKVLEVLAALASATVAAAALAMAYFGWHR
jgi:chromosome segregation ATPase